MTMRKWMTVAILAAALGGCSASDALPAATQAVARFHTAYNSGRDDRLAAMASPAFARSLPPGGFAHVTAGVRARLGRVRTTRPTGWRVNYGMRGGTIMLQYDTRFDSGQAIETFVFDTGTTPPLLTSYAVNLADPTR